MTSRTPPAPTADQFAAWQAAQEPVIHELEALASTGTLDPAAPDFEAKIMEVVGKHTGFSPEVQRMWYNPREMGIVCHVSSAMGPVLDNVIAVLQTQSDKAASKPVLEEAKAKMAGLLTLEEGWMMDITKSTFAEIRRNLEKVVAMLEE